MRKRLLLFFLFSAYMTNASVCQAAIYVTSVLYIDEQSFRVAAVGPDGFLYIGQTN